MLFIGANFLLFGTNYLRNLHYTNETLRIIYTRKKNSGPRYRKNVESLQRNHFSVESVQWLLKTGIKFSDLPELFQDIEKHRERLSTFEPT